MKNKLSKIIERRYVAPGKVLSLTGYFCVPKGPTDIRMVYDATKCALNEILWTPNFVLPTIDWVLGRSSLKTWFGDLDLGEMFHNFFLSYWIRKYAGIDITAMNDPSGENLSEGRPQKRLKLKNRIVVR